MFFFYTENGGPCSGRSDHYHHKMLHSLFIFSVFRSSPLQKKCDANKPKAAIKGAYHRFGKSVSVDGQKNAD